jgi:hypothetical protein
MRRALLFSVYFAVGGCWPSAFPAGPWPSSQLRQGQGVPHRAQCAAGSPGLHRMPPGDHARCFRRLGQEPPRQRQHHLPGLPPGPARRPGHRPGPREVLQPVRPALGRSQVQNAHRLHRDAQGLLPLPSGRGHPVQQVQARQHHRDHVEARPLAEQGHELGQRAQNRLLQLPRHGDQAIDENGKIDPATWPNAGVGRLNLDGSKGSCTSCHTRHRFSVAEARKPEACDQCHLGPDHPQIEIYEESKHGTIYTPTRTSTISMPPAAPGRRAWTTARPPVRPAT